MTQIGKNITKFPYRYQLIIFLLGGVIFSIPSVILGSMISEYTRTFLLIILLLAGVITVIGVVFQKIKSEMIKLAPGKPVEISENTTG